MLDIYTQLEQLFKAKNWQGCINLTQCLPENLISLDSVQQKNYLWWTGQAYRQLSQYEQAELQFQTLSEKFPDNHLGLEGFINIAQQKKDWQQVIAKSLEFQTQFPNLWHSYWWLGRAYFNIKEYEEAEQWFGLLAEEFPKQYHGIYGLAETAYHAKNWEIAIERNLKLQNKFPNLWQGYWWAGYSYKNLKEYSKAEEQFKLLAGKFPKQHHGIYGLAEIAYEMTDWELALSHSMELQTKKSDIWQGYWWAGSAYKNLLQYDKAEEQFHLLNNKLPNLFRGMQGLVNIAQHQKDWGKTIDIAKQFQEKFPDLWHSYWWLGQAYKNLADYDNAIKQFLLAQDKFPNDSHGYQGMIDIANHQNNWQDLLEFSENYIKAFPEKIEGYYHKGNALKNLKQFENAENFFIDLSTQFPDKTQPLTGLANIYYTLRKFGKGIEVLEKAVILFPDNQSIVTQLINYCLKYNEPNKALMHFKNNISDPESVKNQLLLARIYQIKHSNADYVDRLEILYQQYPDDIDVALTYANALINFTMEDE